MIFCSKIKGMKIKLIDIFWLFLKVGSMIFGGGIVIIPLLEEEAVKKRGWITSEELIEYYAISQLIPGINIPDVSMFIGYKLRGKSGALVAGLGVVFIPFLLIVAFSAFLNIIANFSLVKSAIWGVSIGTIVILLSAVKTIWKNSIPDKFTFFLFVLIFILTAFTNLSPVWFIVIALLLGSIKGSFTKKEVE